MPPGESPAVFIHEDTDAAQYPLSPQKPRHHTARAIATATVVAIAEHSLDKLLTRDQLAYAVTAIENEDPEWVFSLFTNPDIQAIPTDHLPALFSHLRPMEVKAGQVLFRQGEPADYYYIIRRGRARASISNPIGGTAATVAELGVGDSFGGSSLLSGERHSATVSMLSDGLLMLLCPHDFNTLIKPPMVHRVAIDDFGTGYSSMGYLKLLPVHVIKIDRCFIQRLPNDSDDAAIVRAIIAMARQLHLEVTVEGVETQAQADFLKAEGSHRWQGHYYSQPLPAPEITPLLGRLFEANLAGSAV